MHFPNWCFVFVSRCLVCWPNRSLDTWCHIKARPPACYRTTTLRSLCTCRSSMASSRIHSWSSLGATMTFHDQTAFGVSWCVQHALSTIIGDSLMMHSCVLCLVVAVLFPLSLVLRSREAPKISVNLEIFFYRNFSENPKELNLPSYIVTHYWWCKVFFSLFCSNL